MSNSTIKFNTADYLEGILPLRLPTLVGSVVAIGNFDGVHKGHQVLLMSAKNQAVQKNLPLVVLTFEPHPREYFAAKSNKSLQPFRLTPGPIKARLLKALGADIVVPLRFDAQVSSLSPQMFVEQILVARLKPAVVMVGRDFVFGANRTGSFDTLVDLGRLHGFTVEGLDAVRDGIGGVYSSTRVREALGMGHFSAASQLLGRAHTIEGPVLRGDQRGRTLGYPTANQSLEGLCLPPYGIYAVRARIEGQDIWHGGAASLGIRPMFEVATPILETHIFDFNDDIYGKNLEVAPVGFLRGEARFSSLDALFGQMKQDCLAARAMLKSLDL